MCKYELLEDVYVGSYNIKSNKLLTAEQISGFFYKEFLQGDIFIQTDEYEEGWIIHVKSGKGTWFKENIFKKLISS